MKKLITFILIIMFSILIFNCKKNKEIKDLKDIDTAIAQENIQKRTGNSARTPAIHRAVTPQQCDHRDGIIALRVVPVL